MSKRRRQDNNDTSASKKHRISSRSLIGLPLLKLPLFQLIRTLFDDDISTIVCGYATNDCELRIRLAANSNIAAHVLAVDSFIFAAVDGVITRYSINDLSCFSASPSSLYYFSGHSGTRECHDAIVPHTMAMRGNNLLFLTISSSSSSSDSAVKQQEQLRLVCANEESIVESWTVPGDHARDVAGAVHATGDFVNVAHETTTRFRNLHSFDTRNKLWDDGASLSYNYRPESAMVGPSLLFGSGANLSLAIASIKNNATTTMRIELLRFSECPRLVTTWYMSNISRLLFLTASKLYYLNDSNQVQTYCLDGKGIHDYKFNCDSIAFPRVVWSSDILIVQPFS